MILDRVNSILQNECNFSKKNPLVVGVSGGPDSLCLLGILHELGYPVFVAHYDHQLRSDSADDARIVADLAGSLGLPLLLGKGDVRALAAERRLSIEESARLARYEFLFGQARIAGAQAVAVAHTADDQVETVLMHLLRGSGLSGLKGMLTCRVMREFDEQIPLARPLLSTWREETVQYCMDHQLQPVIDPTNSDTRFFRNRLRHELIPYLRQYNPQVKEILQRMASSLASDYSYLQSAVRAEYQSCLVGRNQGWLAFDLKAVQQLPAALQRGLIRMGISELRPGLRDIDYESIERAVGFILSPPATHHMDLAAGLDLEYETGRFIIREHFASLPLEDWPQLDTQDRKVLAVPGRVGLSSGWEIVVNLENIQADEALRLAEADPDQACLDAGTLASELEIRCRRAGDRFSPLGMGGHTVKLAEFFINHKLPQRARDAWPLVFSEGRLAWVPGFRPGEEFRVTPLTRRVAHFRLSRKVSQKN